MVMSSGLGRPSGHPRIIRPLGGLGARPSDRNPNRRQGGTSAGHRPDRGRDAELLLGDHRAHTAGMMTHLASLIPHGVFEKFWNLHVLAIDIRLAWVPWFLRSLDTGCEGMPRETPWLKCPPSQYFHQHMRLTTQRHLARARAAHRDLGDVQRQGAVWFSSDYPHWDGDERNHVEKRLSVGVRGRQYREDLTVVNLPRSSGPSSLNTLPPGTERLKPASARSPFWYAFSRALTSIAFTGRVSTSDPERRPIPQRTRYALTRV